MLLVPAVAAETHGKVAVFPRLEVLEVVDDWVKVKDLAFPYYSAVAFAVVGRILPLTMAVVAVGCCYCCCNDGFVVFVPDHPGIVDESWWLVQHDK